MVLEIVFWDVQHGSSTYIKTPDGTKIIQDLGKGSYAKDDLEFSPLKHLKNKYGINKIDNIIITHPHKDHIGDILNFDDFSPSVLTRPVHIPKEDINKNVSDADKLIFEKYFEISERYNSPVIINPKDPSNNGGVNIETFHPKSCSNSNINNQSIVTVITYEGIKVILSGDNELCSWNELLEDNDFKNAILDADVFLAPHHGRKSGFHSDLFDHFKPKLTILSDTKSVETSDTDRYKNVTSGWDVYHRNGNKNVEKRYCLTTRKDGVIVLKIGHNNDTGNSFLNVTID